MPASFIQRQFIWGKGPFKARIRYHVNAVLVGIAPPNSPTFTIAKNASTFFMAQVPTGPRSDFMDRHSCEVRACCTGKIKGTNVIETRFERNYYLTDETIITRIKVNNQDCMAPCTRLICKLIKTV